VHESLEETLLCKLSLINMFDMNVQCMSKFPKYFEGDSPVISFASNLNKLVGGGANRT
jgi:hypothetical protein